LDDLDINFYAPSVNGRGTHLDLDEVLGFYKFGGWKEYYSNRYNALHLYSPVTFVYTYWKLHLSKFKKTNYCKPANSLKKIFYHPLGKPDQLQIFFPIKEKSNLKTLFFSFRIYLKTLVFVTFLNY
jgi:hypothetical protein